MAARKRAIYEEAHRPLVVKLIKDRIQDRETSGYIEQFASRSPNLLKAVTDAVAIPYSRGCQRELHGASEAQQQAFADVVNESGIDRKGNGIGTRAWLLGPTLVSPHLDTRKRLALDVITPDRVELKFSGAYVEAALWLTGSTWIEVDAEGWSYWTLEGKLSKTVPHSVGTCPAIPFIACDNTGSWWSPNDHSGLADATLDVSYKMAYGMWVRQVSGNVLTVVKSAVPNLPAGQSAGHSALPLVFNCDPSQAEVQVLNRIVPARDHLDEIAAIITMAVSAEGIPPGSVQMVANNTDWGNLAISVEGNRLGLLRDRQVPWLRNSELELWPVVCDLLRGSTHKHARILPSGDEVRDMLRVSFPDLSSPKDSLERIEAMKAGLPYGLSSPADWMLAARPELTRSEAEEQLQANLEVYIKTIEPLVSRNIPGQAPEADGHQSIAQQQGKAGGIESGKSRNEGSES